VGGGCENGGMTALAPPLWRQLQAAASVLAAVRRGESATPAIAAVSAELRPAAQALSFHVLRQLGRAEALRRHLAKRGPPPAADALLCTAWPRPGARRCALSAFRWSTRPSSCQASPETRAAGLHQRLPAPPARGEAAIGR
jgi:hypothetical protein